MISQCEDELSAGEGWTIALVVIFSICLLTILFSLACQPKSSTKLSFAVRFWDMNQNYCLLFLALGAIGALASRRQHAHKYLFDDHVRLHDVDQICCMDYSW